MIIYSILEFWNEIIPLVSPEKIGFDHLIRNHMGIRVRKWMKILPLDFQSGNGWGHLVERDQWILKHRHGRELIQTISNGICPIIGKYEKLWVL